MVDGRTGYRLRAEARRDLQDIWRYTRTQWSLRQAKEYRRILTNAFLLLADNPGLGVKCGDGNILKRYRKKPVSHHVIYYRVDGDRIIITRVLHERMEAWHHIRKTEPH